MKKNIIAIVTIALSLILVPVSVHLITDVLADNIVVTDGTVSGGDTVSDNIGGDVVVPTPTPTPSPTPTVSDNTGGNSTPTVSGNTGGNSTPTVSGNTVSGNVPPQGKDPVSDKPSSSTSGTAITVTKSDGTTIQSTIVTSNTSGEVQSVAMVSSKSEVSVAAGLTAANIAEGQYTALSVISSQCGEAAKNVVTQAALSINVQVATILDIDLGIYTKDGALVKYVTQLTTPIQITVSVPVNVVNPENYDFAMVHLHDGVTSVLPDLDNDPSTITVETDGFSVYAIVYGEKGSFGTYKTVGELDSVPKTGAEYPVALPIAVVMGVVLTAGAVVVWKRKRIR